MNPTKYDQDLEKQPQRIQYDEMIPSNLDGFKMPSHFKCPHCG